MAIDPAENQENLDKLYRALGHFMVAYSLIGARMVQTLVPLPGPNAAERATVLTKLDAPKLFKEWSSAMEDHSHATDQDREVVRVLVGEARRLSKVRNRLVHSWWAVDDPNGVLMFKMGEPPRGLYPSAEEFEDYALQAAVIADAVNYQAGLLNVPAGGREGYRKQLVVRGTASHPLEWIPYENGWHSSDGRVGEAPSD